MIELVIAFAALACIFAYLYSKSPESNTISGTVFRLIFLGMCLWTTYMVLWGAITPQVASTANNGYAEVYSYDNYTFMECNTCYGNTTDYYAQPSWSWWEQQYPNDTWVYEWVVDEKHERNETCCKNVTTPVLINKTIVGNATTTTQSNQADRDVVFGFMGVNGYVPLVIFTIIMLIFFYNAFMQFTKDRKSKREGGSF